MALQIKRCPTCGSKKIKLVCKDITHTFKGQTYTARGRVLRMPRLRRASL
jgi:hypothetical protein